MASAGKVYARRGLRRVGKTAVPGGALIVGVFGNNVNAGDFDNAGDVARR